MIAGKGHEHGQEVAGRQLPFDDREVARAAIRGLRGAGRVIALPLDEVAELCPGRAQCRPRRVGRSPA